MDPLRVAEIAACVLKSIPLGIVIIFGRAQTAANNYPIVTKGPFCTLLDIFHVALLVVSTALSTAKGWLMLEDAKVNNFISGAMLREASSTLAMAFSLILLSVIVWRRWRRCLPPSAFVVALLGLQSTACVLDAFRLFTTVVDPKDITPFANRLQHKSLIVSFLLVAAVLGSFLVAEVHDLVIKKPSSSQELTDEDSSSLLARQVSTVLFPLFKNTLRKGASATPPLPVVRRGVRCKQLIQTLADQLSERGVLHKQRGSFVLTLLGVLWMDALRLTLASVFYYSCILGRISALELLINCTSNTGMATAALLFAATTVCEFMLSIYFMDMLNIFGCRARSMLQGLVFSKVTTMSAKSRARYAAGHIASLISVDCSLVCSFVFCVPTPLFGILVLPAVFWMLSRRVGIGPSLCCSGWTIIVLCVPFFASFVQKCVWVKVIRARDERLKTTADLLSTIRVVKMYAWEEAMEQNVLRPRNIELKWLLWANILDGILDCIYSSTSSVLMIILFCTISIMEPDVTLTPSVTFSCVSLLYVTDIAMDTCGQALRIFNQAMVALKRIADFCTAEDQRKPKRKTKEHSARNAGTVVMEKCSFAWPKPVDGISEAQLININLKVRPGSLVGVVGFLASGKSSLLAAILGDMHLIEGDVTCTGRVAFCPQLPVVHNMTIRDNILYGKPMDAPFYHRVIRCCQLVHDINKLEAGDLTEVGEKGTNLSGGQKQRISIARAVYSQSDVYLLDDSLSALDPVVASCVFKEVIGNNGLLQHKTRIMVCNQGNYLHYMDKLVFVNRRRIKVLDRIEDLIKDPEAPENFGETLNQHSLQNGTAIAGVPNIGENDMVGRLTVEELGQSQMTGWQLLLSILRQAQWPAFLGVLAFFGAACAFAAQQLWIKQWTDAALADDDTASPSRQLAWVKVLVALCLTDVVFRIVGSMLLVLSAKKMSRCLHDDMLRHVLHSPVSFFDESPRGRILNRFSVDLEYVDVRAFLSGKQSVQNTLITLSKAAVIGTQSPVLLGVTMVMAALIAFGMNMAVKVSHSARYYESLAMSRLLQHTTDTVDALSSVRAYGATEWFRRHCFRLVDDAMRGYLCFSTTFRFVRTLTATGGFVVVMSTLLVNVLFPGPNGPDPSSLGLALSSACSVPLSLMSLCVVLFNVLQMIVSIERCLQYTMLQPEVDAPTTSSKTKVPLSECLSCWPSEGKIEFQNYSSSYRPYVLRDVLSDVTFTIQPMEKVGVVGRTGAGKSSLLLALLRVLRPTAGHILIDGVDISTVPLHMLRRSITVIPQDPSLVRGTLRLNLDPTNSHSEADIWQALERAHLAKFVLKDPKGLMLETRGGGDNLSVGQRQLVCLARALLRKSKILLLDEATSQMDGDTDRLLQATLREAFADCTVLTVAHRIHTVLDCDRVLVLEDGRVREFDSVQKLLGDSSSDFYYIAREAGIQCARNKDQGVVTVL
ncbi:ATP-binding cassette sub-family C member 3 [Dermacentor silvarum]|uniref:ATP-binding cassette sub-family C member 3 n=1 Tax=Dermacentor silvarum TaxID=543639 RepID=UPI002101BFF4|nr:ATP-binding cassette sub-family C member 3 [Dermacentor silvarum]